MCILKISTVVQGSTYAFFKKNYKLKNVLLTSYSNILTITILTRFLMQEVNKIQHKYKSTVEILSVITLRIGAPVKNGM